MLATGFKEKNAVRLLDIILFARSMPTLEEAIFQFCLSETHLFSHFGNSHEKGNQANNTRLGQTFFKL